MLRVGPGHQGAPTQHLGSKADRSHAYLQPDLWVGGGRAAGFCLEESWIAHLESALVTGTHDEKQLLIPAPTA